MDNTYEIGLVELIPPTTYIHPKGKWEEIYAPGTSPGTTKTAELYGQDRSKVTLANYKMMELAVKFCTKMLFVSFSGPPPSNMREIMPEMYNTLWDLCIEANRITLDCRIIMGVDGLKTKVIFFFLIIEL